MPLVEVVHSVSSALSGINIIKVLTVRSLQQHVNGPLMSHDRVRKIVQEEGRAARNLIAYNVPAGDGGQTKTGK